MDKSGGTYKKAPSGERKCQSKNLILHAGNVAMRAGVGLESAPHATNGILLLKKLKRSRSRRVAGNMPYKYETSRHRGYCREGEQRYLTGMKEMDRVLGAA